MPKHLPPTESRFNIDTLLSENPAKAATERYFLWYTPVWGVIVGVVMLSGLAEQWGDWELMALGVTMFVGAIVGPVFRRLPCEAGQRWYERSGVKIVTSITLFSFLLNYFGTRYFYEVLHAHYGFQAEILLHDVPLFLYFLTVAYFSTYYVLLMIGARVCKRQFGDRPALYKVSLIALPFAVAVVESALNANPFMKRLYCFDNLTLALSLGTVVYGVWLAAVMPFWLTLDETTNRLTPFRRVVVGALAATLLCICAGDLIKYTVAPHFTTVKHGHVGLRDSPSCLIDN